MATINTLRGALDTSELGRTLIHEHIGIRSPGIAENWPELWDETACVPDRRGEAHRARSARRWHGRRPLDRRPRP